MTARFMKKTLITGHTNLNYMIAKIDNTKSELCDTCKVKESISHYLYDCKIYEEDIDNRTY